MAINKPRLFSDIFVEWPPGVAESLLELISVDFESLKSTMEETNVDPEIADIIYFLRSQGVEVRNSATSEPALSSP